MNKVLLIAKREFLTRVRRKSFIIMTLLGPFIMLLLMVVPYWLTSTTSKDQQVYIMDESGKVEHKMMDFGNTSFYFINTLESDLIVKQKQIGERSVIVHVPKDYSSQKITIAIKGEVGPLLIEYIKTKIQFELLGGKSTSFAGFSSTHLNRTSQEKSNEVATFLSLLLVVLIYFFIFLYGIQIMKGVIEEKSNRIVEIIISSVKPFQLMAGKIMGLGLLGFLQYGIWLFFSVVIYGLVYNGLGLQRLETDNAQATFAQLEGKLNALEAQNVSAFTEAVQALEQINMPLVILAFSLFFVLGYSLYAAMFATIGAISDADTETQQFIFPVTFPLIFSFIMLDPVLQNTDGMLAKVLSYLPFTSPIIMMARVPFESMQPGFFLELFTSLLLLLIGVLITTWFSAKVYRTGILLYGKKIGLKEIFKWMMK